MTRIDSQVKWSAVPDWISDHEKAGLSHAAVRLYAILDRFANSEGEGIVPSRKTLARRMGLRTTDRVDAAKQELVEAGALVVSPRFDEGRQLTNEYRLIQVQPEETRQGGRENSVGVGRENSVGPRRENSVQNESQGNESTPDGVRARPRDAVFDSLTGRFGPAPQGRNARGAWNRATADLKADGWDGETPSLADLERVYNRLYDGAAFTPTALATHFTRLSHELAGKRRAAAAACPECEVGGGHHAAGCSRIAVAA